jgi:hypothetical protein
MQSAFDLQLIVFGDLHVSLQKKTPRFVRVFCMLMQMYLCQNYDFSLVFFQASPCALLQAFGFQVMFKHRLFSVYINVFVKVRGAFGYKNNVFIES